MEDETKDTAGILPLNNDEQLYVSKLRDSGHYTKKAGLTTWDELGNHGGVTRVDVFKIFHDRFGQQPKQVHLNDGICKTFNKPCFNYFEEVTYSTQGSKISQQVGNSRMLANNSDVDVSHEINLTTSKEKSATVTVTKEASFSAGQKVSLSSEPLGISSEFSVEFTIENSVGSTDSKREEVTVGDTTKVILKPGDKVIIDLDVSWRSLEEEFEIPCSINGWVGADFGKKVNGHYYWFMHLSPLPPWNLKRSYLRGTVETAYDISGKCITNSAS